MKKIISDSQLLILILLLENKKLSGYEIGKKYISSKYDVWIKLSKIAIYKALSNLEKTDLVVVKKFKQLGLKGPISKEYILTLKGKIILENEIIDSIKHSFNSNRFNISLMGIGQLNTKILLKALKYRIRNLSRREEKLRSEFNENSNTELSDGHRAIIAHLVNQMDSDIEFAQTLYNLLLNNYE